MTEQNQSADTTTEQPKLSTIELLNEGEEAPQPEVQPEEEAPKPKKVFSRADVKPTIPINVIFPEIFPDYEPFGFKMRLKLSREAQEQREQHHALAAKKQTENYTLQCLNEVCDLITELPTGFSDLKEIGHGPGASFRSYFEHTNNPDEKAFLSMVVEAASAAYWGAVQPLRFRG